MRKLSFAIQRSQKHPSGANLLYNLLMADNHLPFFRRTWVYITFWLVLSVGGYGVCVQQLGGMRFLLQQGKVDILLLGVLLLLWLMFFAQFILPVRQLSERRQIITRLLLSLIGERGPAIFIRNGYPIERKGEEERKGPGVLWLDTASGAVTRTATTFRQTIGPGVHFTAKNEKLAGTVDLRRQMQRIGPFETDDPFAPAKDANDLTYKEVQRRRAATTALTRDGIEVVPNIVVIFKIDADPVQQGPGSRFGYSEDAVFKAIAGEAINPERDPNSSTYRVPWNQLPALIAVDLWREYLSKFTLKQLFEAEFTPPPSPTTLNQPPVDVKAVSHPLRAAQPWQDELANWLHEINQALKEVLEFCPKKIQQSQPNLAISPAPSLSRGASQSQEKETGLQIIQRMVKDRMTSPRVAELDPYGQATNALIDSPEYQVLCERGIRIIAVTIGNLRFPPAVESELVHHWKATWLENAQEERKSIEERRHMATIAGQEKSLEEYTVRHLSGEILKLKERRIQNWKDVTRALVLKSHTVLIRNHSAHYHPVTEQEELEEILRWLESKPSSE